MFLVPLIGCQSEPDFDTLRSKIMSLHRELIEAHYNKDIDFFIKDISENFISVSNGEIQFPTKEEIITQFSNYLNNTTFTEYKDLQEPVIGFSKDGSVAWVIVRVKVAGKQTLDDGSKRDLDFICAWITLYERQGNRWIRTVEVSNFK